VDQQNQRTFHWSSKLTKHDPFGLVRSVSSCHTCLDTHTHSHTHRGWVLFFSVRNLFELHYRHTSPPQKLSWNQFTKSRSNGKQN